MQFFFHDTPLTYDGSQLISHFAYNQFGLLGNSIVCFRGSCEVTTHSLVDLEDAQKNLFIKSKEMLHFIIEMFDCDLNLAIARQRLFITNIIDEICDSDPQIKLSRRGNDIYDGIYKLSVSIATASPISCLIHTGININADGAPINAKGLLDYGLNPDAIATGIMNRFIFELESMQKARVKVRHVK